MQPPPPCQCWKACCAQRRRGAALLRETVGSQHCPCNMQLLPLQFTLPPSWTAAPHSTTIFGRVLAQNISLKHVKKLCVSVQSTLYDTCDSTARYYTAGCMYGAIYRMMHAPRTRVLACCAVDLLARRCTKATPSPSVLCCLKTLMRR